MTANLGRCRRLDKQYSRARDRVETLRTVDQELHEQIELPLFSRDDDSDQTPLATLMQVGEDPDASPPAS